MQQMKLPNKKDIRNKDTRLFTDLPLQEQKAVIKWIGENFLPRKTALDGWSSYGLKHFIQNDIGIYMTNCQFKGAMLQCGYEPVKFDELNWVFGLSKKSPAFTRGISAF
jgi:hypothetical protein